MIDDRLTWKCHVDYVCNKLSKSIGIICKAKKALNKSTLLNLYNVFVYPHLSYCTMVWGSTYQTTLNKVIIIQKKIIRIISNAPFLHPTKDLFQQLNVLKFQKIIEFQYGLFIYKYVHEILPTPFQNIFNYNRNIHGYNTRQCDAFHITRYRTVSRKHTINILAPSFWNRIQKD